MMMMNGFDLKGRYLMPEVLRSPRVVELEAERDALLRALEDLYVEQDGPPHARRRGGWDRAMERAGELIRKRREGG